MKVKAELNVLLPWFLFSVALILIVTGLLVLILPTLSQTISRLEPSTVLTKSWEIARQPEFVTKHMLSTIVSGIQENLVLLAADRFYQGLTR